MVDHSPHAAHWEHCPGAPPFVTSLDPMSNGMHHFSAPHKIRWGWISPEEVRMVDTGTVILYATEGPYAPGRPKAIRVLTKKSGYYHSYVLEYRSATASLVPGPGSYVQVPGVYLYADNSGSNNAEADLVEPLDETSSLTEFRTRPLPLGIPVEDATLRFIFRVEAIDRSRAAVRISRSTW